MIKLRISYNSVTKEMATNTAIIIDKLVQKSLEKQIEDIKDNPGLRTIAKPYLNSLKEEFRKRDDFAH